MSNYTKQLNELFECNNLVTHIGKRLNLLGGNSTQAKAVVIHSRSVLTLRNKISGLTKEDPYLTTNFQLGLDGLQKLVHFSATVSKKFTEDSEEVLSSKQREALQSFYEAVRDGVLYCAGYIAFIFESSTDATMSEKFYEDKKDFIEKAKGTYALINEQEERGSEVDEMGEVIRPIMSMKTAQETKESELDGDTDVVLGSTRIDSDPLK